MLSKIQGNLQCDSCKTLQFVVTCILISIYAMFYVWILDNSIEFNKSLKLRHCSLSVIIISYFLCLITFKFKIHILDFQSFLNIQSFLVVDLVYNVCHWHFILHSCHVITFTHNKVHWFNSLPCFISRIYLASGQYIFSMVIMRKKHNMASEIHDQY